MTTVKISTDATIEELLNAVCTRSDLNNSEHFLRMKKHETEPEKRFFAPARTDVISNYVMASQFKEYCLSF